jgi:AcrR family transcriptional regulator
MPSIIRRIVRSARSRIKQDLREQRTFQLYQAGCHLLARADHEQVSVARIARKAGCSVGAFYQRFHHKNAFLDMVIARRIGSAREHLQQELEPARWRHSSARAVIRAIIEEMMRSLHGSSAGVFRAALKRGHLDREKLEPLVAYRKALADCAVALLAHRVRGVRSPARSICITMQIAEATALDALLHDAGDLRPGSRKMAETLAVMMLGLLHLSGHENQDEHLHSQEPSEAINEHSADSMLEMPIEEVVAIPMPRGEPSRRPRMLPRQTPERVAVLTVSPASAIRSEGEQASMEPKRARLL